MIWGSYSRWYASHAKPYAAWVQRLPPGHFKALADSLREVCGQVTKSDLDLDLEETERVAAMVFEEDQDTKGEQDVKGVIKSLEGMGLNKTDAADIDSDDDSCSDDDSSSESDSSGSESETDSKTDDNPDKCTEEVTSIKEVKVEDTKKN